MSQLSVGFVLYHLTWPETVRPSGHVLFSFHYETHKARRPTQNSFSAAESHPAPGTICHRTSYLDNVCETQARADISEEASFGTQTFAARTSNTELAFCDGRFKQLHWPAGRVGMNRIAKPPYLSGFALVQNLLCR